VASLGRVQLTAFTALQAADAATGSQWRGWGLNGCGHGLLPGSERIQRAD
jgi:hypothetical protein